LVLEDGPAFIVLGLLDVSLLAAIVIDRLLGSDPLPVAATGFAALGMTLNAGLLLGVAASYFIPQSKPIELPPGSRYVPKGRSGAGGCCPCRCGERCWRGRCYSGRVPWSPASLR
jgi:hypothetical protein